MKARAQKHWRRSLRRAGLPLALFAIVLHVVVSLGHHHFDLSATRSSTNAISVSSPTALAPLPRGDRRNVPIVPVHGPCLVCLAIHASAAPVVDVLPGVLPLYDNGTTMPLPARAFLTVTPRVAAFHSRAPPLG